MTKNFLIKDFETKKKGVNFVCNLEGSIWNPYLSYDSSGVTGGVVVVSEVPKESSCSNRNTNWAVDRETSRIDSMSRGRRKLMMQRTIESETNGCWQWVPSGKKSSSLRWGIEKAIFLSFLSTSHISFRMNNEAAKDYWLLKKIIITKEEKERGLKPFKKKEKKETILLLWPEKVKANKKKIKKRKHKTQKIKKNQPSWRINNKYVIRKMNHAH